MVEVPPLAAPQRGSCASSRRAWRLCLGSSALPGNGRPTGRPAIASGARASRLQSRRFPALLSIQALRALQALAGAKNKEDAEKLRAAIAAAAPHAVALPALAAELAAGQRTLDRLDCEAPPG